MLLLKVAINQIVGVNTDIISHGFPPLILRSCSENEVQQLIQVPCKPVAVFSVQSIIVIITKQKFLMYPGPGSDVRKVKLKKKSESMKVTSLTGKAVITTELPRKISSPETETSG